MSFGTGGGFGGFGQSKPTFGGFGSTNNNNTTSTGFGSNTTGAFGANNNAGGSLFGGGGSTTGGFGSNGGTGFGANNTTSAFGGGTPGGFGSNNTTGGSLFGGGGASSTPATGSGFGGFGSNNNTTSAFGAGNTGGTGLFGSASKPAFGTNNTTTGAFGSTGGSFGTGNTTSAFGAPASTALQGPVGECTGTASVQFAPFQEKEPNSSTNQSNAFQNICFQAPYQKFSQEELRMADYVQGRRWGNPNGQAGAFGTSSFGGFGNTSSTPGFGTNNNTNTGGGLFGATSTTTTGGFGQNNNSNTTGGLFGAKPAATGGLFGSSSTTPAFGANTNTNTGGSLFGQNNNTTTTNAFGQNNTATNTGGGLFGQNKPAASGFSFGNSQPAATGGTGFGNTTGGAFGSNTGGGGLFGNNNQQQNNTASPFGANNQQQNTTSSLFGANNNQQQNNPSSLFGANNNQQKPGGLFGNTTTTNNTGGGLFGNTNTTNTGGGLFGQNNATQNNTGTGLFGAKPATPTTGGLFGQTNNTSTGGGLFGGLGGNNAGQNQQQQNNTSSLFGGNNNQQKPGGLFGQSQPQTNSLFGGSQQQQGGGGLFGGMNNNQNQQNTSSIFGGSTLNNSTQGQQPQSFTTSINDPKAFGNSMFSTLGSANPENPGPIATPLSSKPKQKRSSILPMYKLSPASNSSRFTTPQKRGYGFSYSSYGTPVSGANSVNGPPGAFGNNLLGASLNSSRLTKSMSASGLRNSYSAGSFSPQDSILAPGAFSASTSARNYGSVGSMKKLVINRGIRSDLFTPPPPKESGQSGQSASPGQKNGILKKQVSWDANTVGGSAVNGSESNVFSGTSSPLKQVQNSFPSSEEMGYLRSSTRGSSKPNGTTSSPEMEQVKGNELAVVPENSAPSSSSNGNQSSADPFQDLTPGQYWMKPSKEEIMNLNRAQRSKVSGFTVGREGCGQITFDVPVDLNNIDLDELFEKVVILEVRRATVYPDQSKKPPMGKGLNVPSTIRLMNSWPRSKDRVPKGHPRYNKHAERLSKVPDTHFVEYNDQTGVWTFRVDHYTTYGLDYDDDDESVVEEDSALTELAEMPTPVKDTPRAFHPDDSFASSEMTEDVSELEDTFEFKRSNNKTFPGAFDRSQVYVDEDMEDTTEQEEQSFLGDRSVGSESDDEIDQTMTGDDVFQSQELVGVEDQEMVGSFPQPDETAELRDDSPEHDVEDVMTETPGAIMRARLRAMKASSTPSKRKFATGDTWTEALQQSVSPKKQDRKHLKDMIELQDASGELEVSVEAPTPRNRSVSGNQGFATSIDLMNSLFGQPKNSPKKAKAPAKKGFQWPYAKHSHDNDDTMDPKDRDFHNSMKPSWGPDGTVIYSGSAPANDFRSSRPKQVQDGLLVYQEAAIVSESRDVRFAKFSNEYLADSLEKQRSITEFKDQDGVPLAFMPETFTFTSLYDDVDVADPAAQHEKLVWELAGVLFDDTEVPADLKDMPNILLRLRKDKLSAFWQKLVEKEAQRDVAMAQSNEEKAIACLSAHRVPDACAHLLTGKDFHLASLVALIGGKESVKKSIHEQLTEWRNSHVLSEFSAPVRALYELLAGNACVCDGNKGGPVEDRIDTFIISQRFGLDWRRAFGLRLWYAIATSDDIAAAIQAFNADLQQDRETARPRAWYVEQGIPALWDDKDFDRREDLLWGLLKLYATGSPDLQAILRPENSQLSPLDFRLSWQLGVALNTAGMPYSYESEADHNEKADRLTLAFANQLTGSGNWLEATFVFLHLSNAGARKKAIKDHLAHHAGLIGSEGSTNYTTLTQDLHIPFAWLWEAKALYERAVTKNSHKEVDCLLRANLHDEAHKTFSREVAPRCVVEREYSALEELLKGFHGDVKEWALGGQVYADFLQLVKGRKSAKGVDAKVLERLLASLPEVVQENRQPGFLERVAVTEISSIVAAHVVEMGKNGIAMQNTLPKVLGLPMTEDRTLKHTVDLSVGYYRALMAGGR